MMYPFMTLDDNAEIVHSEMGKDGRVKVYIEKPDAKDGFHWATCYFLGKVGLAMPLRRSKKAWMLYGILVSGTMKRMKKY